MKIRHVWTVSYLFIIFGASGCAGLLNPETVERSSENDIMLSMKIKAQLIEAPELSAAAINVEASNGLVVLSGFVETESQQQIASSIAQETPNVTQVDNQIQVKANQHLDQ